MLERWWISAGSQYPAFCLNGPQLDFTHKPRCQAVDNCLQAAPSASMGISPGTWLAASDWPRGQPCGEDAAGRLSGFSEHLGDRFLSFIRVIIWLHFLSLRTILDSRVLLSWNLAESKTELKYLSLVLGESWGLAGKSKTWCFRKGVLHTSSVCEMLQEKNPKIK